MRAINRCYKETQKVSVARICRIICISRQAFHQGRKRMKNNIAIEAVVLSLAIVIRKRHSKMSCKKIYDKIKPNLVDLGIKMGRDKCINLLVNNDLHVKPRRVYRQTTQSNHGYNNSPNLIKGLEITHVNQVWVSDITYLRTSSGFKYLALVTDLYSRKIVGCAISDTLEAEFCLRAYRMAVKNNKNEGPEIHHSDRGIQYHSKEYRQLLAQTGSKSSMTKGGAPHENAVAERVNGILKTEYSISDKHQSPELSKQLVKQAVYLYNTDRPHLSLKMKTPEQVYNEFNNKI